MSNALSDKVVKELAIALASTRAAEEVANAIEAGVAGPNAVNKFTIYVSQTGGDDSTGDGSIGFPYATIEKALSVIPLVMDGPYNIKLGAGQYSTTGSYVWRGGINLIGDSANNTVINSPIDLTGGSGETTINQFSGVYVGLINVDVALSSFASISIINGAVALNRLDSNPAALISMQGGIFASTINGGQMIISGGYLFADVTVMPGATLYCSNMSSVGGKFLLKGDAHLKTVGGLFSLGGEMVDGEIVLGDTPTWETDKASDFGYTGDVDKTLL